jgi:DNA-binding MurR/RpiR family transcriptional regulator
MRRSDVSDPLVRQGTDDPDEREETFDALRGRIKARFDGLSPHLQWLARYALEDPNLFALETVTEVATRASVQPSTVIRFAKEFGYTGFTQMQKVFRLRLIEGIPASRTQAFLNRKRLEGAAAVDPGAILSEFSDASIANLERLKLSIASDDLRQAVRMITEAEHIYVIGQRRAFPIAAYFAYGLIRLEFRCTFLDFVGGMVPQQVATMRPNDILIAVAFAEYTPAVVDIVQDVHIRRVPILSITDVPASPLAKHASLSFLVDEMDIHRFKPIAASICLVQSLMITLGAVREP